MKESAHQIATRLANGETVNRVEMPELKDILMCLESIQHNTKGCISQLKKAIKEQK